MRALVTGGTGFIGNHVVKELLRDKWDVTVLYRPRSDLSRLANLDVELVEGDINNAFCMKEILKPGFDGVFHIAGDVSLWKMKNRLQNDINIKGTKTLARACLEGDVGRFIHTSTASVWGLMDGTINEHSPKFGNVAPVNYMRSKFYGEQEVLSCRDEGLDAVILNPCHVMGPFDNNNWSQLFLLVSAGKLPGVPPGLGTFCHVEDVARAHVQAFHHGETGRCYLLGGEQLSYFDICRKISQILCQKQPSLLPKWLFMAVGQAYESFSWLTGREPMMTPEKAHFLSMDLKVNSNLAENRLQYRVRTIDEILTDTFQWLKSRGLVNY